MCLVLGSTSAVSQQMYCTFFTDSRNRDDESRIPRQQHKPSYSTMKYTSKVQRIGLSSYGDLDGLPHTISRAV